MQRFAYTNLYVSCLNKHVHVKELVIYSGQEFSVSTFTAHFKFKNLFLLVVVDTFI